MIKKSCGDIIISEIRLLSVITYYQQIILNSILSMIISYYLLYYSDNILQDNNSHDIVYK